MLDTNIVKMYSKYIKYIYIFIKIKYLVEEYYNFILLSTV